MLVIGFALIFWFDGGSLNIYEVSYPIMMEPRFNGVTSIVMGYV